MAGNPMQYEMTRGDDDALAPGDLSRQLGNVSRAEEEIYQALLTLCLGALPLLRTIDNPSLRRHILHDTTSFVFLL
jgi:hypothetical protein